MKIKSVQKNILTSPKKLRLVVHMIKNLGPVEAVEVLPLSGKRAATPLAKVIKSALANAKEKGFSESELVFDEIQINEGPRLKRGRPVSKGRWHPYKRRMSHIRIVLKTKNEKPKVQAKGKLQKKVLKILKRKEQKVNRPINQ